MGFSNIASSVIMFIAVLSISTGIVIVLRNYVSDTGNSVAIQKDIIKNQLRSDVNIDLISYDGVNLTTVYMKNTGKTVLSMTDIDIYIDKARTPRNESNRTINLLADTDISDTGNWNPDEIIEIKVVRPLGTGTHEVIINTEHQATDREEFST